MSKNYSKVYLVKGEKHFGYRYNNDDCVLEYVSRWDCEIDGNGKLVDVILPDWEVVSSIGLSRDEWKESPDYWVEQYSDELHEEVSAMISFEFAQEG
jgi:hypothetical protein